MFSLLLISMLLTMTNPVQSCSPPAISEQMPFTGYVEVYSANKAIYFVTDRNTGCVQLPGPQFIPSIEGGDQGCRMMTFGFCAHSPKLLHLVMQLCMILTELPQTLRPTLFQRVIIGVIRCPVTVGAL